MQVIQMLQGMRQAERGPRRLDGKTRSRRLYVWMRTIFLGVPIYHRPPHQRPETIPHCNGTRRGSLSPGGAGGTGFRPLGRLIGKSWFREKEMNK